MKGFKIFLGLAFIAIAVLLILEAIGITVSITGVIGEISFWQIIGGIFFISGIIKLLASGEIWEIFVLLGLLFMIFERNIALVELTMEEGITSIGISAFAGCKALQKVTIPASVQTIGDLAFSWCTALKEVVFLGNAPDNIGNTIFDKKTVTIYYDPATSGWDTTKMKEKYTLIPIA